MAQNKINGYTLIIIGGSAGSLDTIIKIVSALPAVLMASLIIVVHRKNSGESILVDLLAAKTPLPVREVEDKDPIAPGAIYIAPPDYHLLLDDESTFSLDTSEKIHFSRPSIDVAFQSAASVYTSRLVGVLLSGANADGAEGLKAVQEAGGLTIVQDPASADMAYMPQQAINIFKPDMVLTPDALAEFIRSLFK